MTQDGAHALASGEIIADRYEVLGAGRDCPGYCAYRAFDRDAEVEVALWCVYAELFASQESAEGLLKAAFEVRAVTHANVRRLFDAGPMPGGLFAAVQLASDTLQEQMAEGLVASGEELLRYASGICDGLQAGHDVGLVHGRLVPQDVVQVAGLVKVGGLGMWGHAEPQASRVTWRNLSRYIAPEAWEHSGLTPLADVFSAAVVLGEFACDARLRAQLDGVGDLADLLATSQPDVAAALLPGMSARPSDRPPSAEALLHNLRRALVDENLPTGRHAPVVRRSDDRAPTVPRADRRAPGEEESTEERPPDAMFQRLTEPGIPTQVSASISEEMDTVDARATVPMPVADAGSAEQVTVVNGRAGAIPDDDGDTAIMRPDPVRSRTPVQLPLRAEPTAIEPAPVAPGRGDDEAQSGITEVAPPPQAPRDAQAIHGLAQPSDEPPEPGNPLVLTPSPFAKHLQDRDARGTGAHLLIGVITAVGMAAVVWVALAVVYDDPQPGVGQAAKPDAGRSEATTAAVPVIGPPAAQDNGPVVVSPTSGESLDGPCPEQMTLVETRRSRYCIDLYESPGEGRLPHTGVTFDEAKESCTERGVRMCTSREWERACRGEGGSSWPYGWTFHVGWCNADPYERREIVATGDHKHCVNNVNGAHDLSGNAAEWVANGRVRGGSATDDSDGRCSRGRRRPADRKYSDVGFRCCADAR